jgi:hypothetical protein
LDEASNAAFDADISASSFDFQLDDDILNTLQSPSFNLSSTDPVSMPSSIQQSNIESNMTSSLPNTSLSTPASSINPLSLLDAASDAAMEGEVFMEDFDVNDSIL